MNNEPLTINKIRVLRQKISFYLDDIDTPAGTAVNLMVAGLVLISSGIFVAETYDIQESLNFELDIINATILVIFILEYGLRFWCAENKLNYLFSLYSLIDLVAILPSLIWFVDIRFVRIFRWFRILRLIRFLEPKALHERLSDEDNLIVNRILFTLFAIIFVYSGLIYQVEHSANPDAFGTFLDAVYFSVVTMTTVGFGDVTPISEVGRLMTVLMILTGVVLIPWQLGDLIKRLVKSVEQVKQPCPGCGFTFHDADAQFCKFCGTQLSHDTSE